MKREMSYLFCFAHDYILSAERLIKETKKAPFHAYNRRQIADVCLNFPLYSGDVTV